MAKNNQKTENLDSKENPKKKEKRGVLIRKKRRLWTARILLAFLSLAFIFISLFWIPANLTYRVNETFTITSSNSTELDLVVLLPTTGPYQRLIDPEVAWPGSWQAERLGRVNLIRLEGAIQADETLTAVITYDVNLRMGEAIWMGEPVTSAALLPQEDIPSDSPDIITQSKSLTVTNDSLATAIQIYDAVVSYHDLENSRDSANVLAAFNRAAQIPTLVVRGWVLPNSVPLLSQQIAPEIDLRGWNEVFLQDTWQVEDASCCRSFPKRRLLGWTDGRHLVLDEVENLDSIYQSLVDEAEQDGAESVSSSSPAFVAWSLADEGGLEVTPVMMVRKTWDGRWAMAIAVVVILTVLEWMMETDHYTKKSRQMVSVAEE